jgi:hypothetical protein
MWRRARWFIIGSTLLLVPVLMIVRYADRNDVLHEAIKLWVRLYGDAVYEYNATTGQWPVQIDDLARTSLPQRFPYWKQRLAQNTIVMVWNKDLKSDPNDNASLILAYHNKGLYAELGRVWVCWGDLRTEYIKREELQVKLQIRTK